LQDRSDEGKREGEKEWSTAESIRTSAENIAPVAHSGGAGKRKLGSIQSQS